MPERPVTAILLAAGSSRRMGERNKLLLPWHGRTIVETVADALVTGGCEEVVAVLGHQSEAVATALGDRPLRTTHNPRHAEGLASSIAAGVAAAPRADGGYLIALGDMPGLQAATVTALRLAFSAAGAEAIVVPVTGGRRGNPVVFSHRYAAELRQLEGDVGARSLLTRHREQVVELELSDAGIFTDVSRCMRTPLQVVDAPRRPEKRTHMVSTFSRRCQTLVWRGKPASATAG